VIESATDDERQQISAIANAIIAKAESLAADKNR
jgi:hypothetical protein